MSNLTISEKLLYTTTKVITYLNGQPRGTGTAFFYNIRVDEDRFINLLITNRHVVEGSNAISIVFHRLADGNPGPSGDLLT